MPTQKIFKRRVRARMTKTGESYTTARRQLIRKAVPSPAADELADDAAAGPPLTPPLELPVADEAIRRATGRGWEEWFEILDRWGGTGHRHPEIARWLREEQQVDGWWAQSVTVGYERARGMRDKHQVTTGFSIGVTKTVNVAAEQALAAFTDARRRGRWLTGVGMRQRPTRAANTARFDWPDPRSIVIVYIGPKGPDRSTVAVQHERLPDAETAERLKVEWRARLGQLKAELERS